MRLLSLPQSLPNRLTFLLYQGRYCMLRFSSLAALLLLALHPTIGALADGSFSVRPTRINLENTQRNAEITVTNGGSTPELLRVGAMSWEQVGGKERYAPTDELLVVPPLLRVEAGQERIVRLALRGVLSGTHERSYRIFLTEVPSKIKSEAPGVQVALRFGIPVYVNAGSPKTTEGTAGLEPSAEIDGAKRIHLQLANGGERHVVISTIRIYSDISKSRSVGEKNVNTALLAGAYHSFELTANEALRLPMVLVQGTGANGPFELTVPVMQAVPAATHRS